MFFSLILKNNQANGKWKVAIWCVLTRNFSGSVWHREAGCHPWFLSPGRSCATVVIGLGVSLLLPRQFSQVHSYCLSRMCLVNKWTALPVPYCTPSIEPETVSANEYLHCKSYEMASKYLLSELKTVSLNNRHLRICTHWRITWSDMEKAEMEHVNVSIVVCGHVVSWATFLFFFFERNFSRESIEHQSELAKCFLQQTSGRKVFTQLNRHVLRMFPQL